MAEKNQLKHGVQPFWFWNGAMEDEEIRRQIGEMKAQGLKGFLIHPRQGMEVPYLSGAYFEKVRVAVEAAKEKELEVWLYDEFPYPSGISGGKVTLEHPEYACTELKKVTATVHGGQTAKLYAPWGKVVLARAYRVREGVCRWDDFVELADFVGSGYQQDVFQLKGLTKYNRKRYFQGELAQYLYWKAPEGCWKVYLYTETVMKHFKYFENFIDPLNPAAVKYFLETTHEKYKEYLGDEFGKTIKGIFTDEVTAFPPLQPWSPLLPEIVREMSGLDLISCLPALTEDMGEITEKVRYAYWNAATEQFIKSWDCQVYHWCEQNHLLYIGEKPIMRSKQLQYTHVPGIDAGHQKFGSKAVLVSPKYRANGKIASSAAHFYQKPAALCEAFHSIGWGMTLQDAKWIFDWLAVMGIDWFITHGAYYTTDGLKKHDAPPSSFYQMPWWRDAHELTAYVDELHHFLDEGTRRVPVLLLDPVTSTWTETGERAAKLKQDFADLQNQLLHMGVDYYIMDPQLFAAGKVVKAGEETYYENCGDSYSVIVLPFMTNLEPAAVTKLQEYVECGGRTVAAGTLPYQNMEGLDYAAQVKAWFQTEPSAAYEAYFEGAYREKEAAEGWHQNCYFAADYKAAAAELCRISESKRHWRVGCPEDAEVLWIEGTDPDGKDKLFLTNLGTADAEVTVAHGKHCATLALSGGASRFLSEEELGKLSETADRTEADKEIELAVDEELPMKPLSLNALRVGMWQMELPDGQKALADSIPLIDQMEQSGLKINICQRDYFGCPKELEFPQVEARYTYSFQNELPAGTEVYLVMEPGTLLGEWALQVNGTAFCADDFAVKPIYLPTNLAVPVTSCLKAGENKLELHLKSDKSFGGIRNPLYLCGSFAVAWQSGVPVLQKAREKGKICDLTQSGLPYYAGTVEYTKAIPAEWKEGDGAVRFRIKNQDFHDAVRLQIGGEELGSSSFAPYEFVISGEALQKADQLVICVDTTLSRLFEGEWFDEKAHCYRRIWQESKA